MDYRAITGDLPKPSRSVLNDLNALHPGLFIVPMQYAYDELTSNIRLHKGEPIHKPRYHVFLEDNDGQIFHLFAHETPEGEYLPCDNRLLDRLNGDLARVCGHDANAIERKLREMEEEEIAKATKEHEERVLNSLEANAGVMRGSCESGVLDIPEQNKKKDSTIYSYDGQPIRSTSSNSIPLTDEELGIEIDGRDRKRDD